MREFDESGEMLWEVVSPPLWWKEASAFVVADRHLPNGVRQHMVGGSVELGKVVSNAQVIGRDNMPYAKYSSELSHLSRTDRGCVRII